jgi:hypothetical protein
MRWLVALVVTGVFILVAVGKVLAPLFWLCGLVLRGDLDVGPGGVGVRGGGEPTRNGVKGCVCSTVAGGGEQYGGPAVGGGAGTC